MKTILLFSLLSTTILSTITAQSDSLKLETIIKKTIFRTKSLKSIAYDIEKVWVFMGEEDTMRSSASCVMDKRVREKLLGQRCQLAIPGYEFLYDGTLFYRKEDTASTILSFTPKEMDLSFWRDNFLDYWLNYRVIPQKMNEENIVSKKYIGLQKILNHPCHTIEIIASSKDLDSKEIVFIRQKDFIPIKSIITTTYMGLVQHSEKTLSNIKINKCKHKINTKAFLKNAVQITPYIKPKRNTQKQIKNLTIGDTIPDWNNIRTLNERELLLSDLKADVILIDFWYMSCYPCLKSFPSIKKLQEKYSKKQLNIISINPYDIENKTLLKSFAAKHKINYPILLANIETTLAFKISSYPTFILVDKSRTIQFIQKGYSDKLYETLSNQIDTLLK